MDFWQKAKIFAEEAAKRSQEITKEAAKKSQDLTKGAAKISQDFVNETAKKSRELAVEATKKADQIKIEALKRADQIKSLTDAIPVSISLSDQEEKPKPLDLEKFGITDELRDFAKGFSSSIFMDFPVEDGSQASEVPTVSNVRQDLTEWQAKHATLVLSTVKEISRLRYELCPRHMKERRFWRIYFILVNSHVASYEKKYQEEAESKELEKKVSESWKQDLAIQTASKPQTQEAMQQNKQLSSHVENDLDSFLLGDIGSSDEDPDGDIGFDDDFDKAENDLALDSEIEGDVKTKET